MRMLLACCCLLGLVSTTYAQQPPSAQPSNEHAWLKQFVGEWTSTSKPQAGEGQPAVSAKGTMKSEMLGGYWVVNQVKVESGGMSNRAVQTLGYDQKKKKYVGTWVDAMLDHMWIYEGDVDASGKKLTLVTEGPNFMTGESQGKYRDSYEFKSPDWIVAVSEVMDENGKWTQFMTGEMRRVKP